MTTATLNADITFALRNVVRHLTPSALAVLSVELEAADRNSAESEFLDAVNTALSTLVSDEEAEQHRQWVRENVA